MKVKGEFVSLDGERFYKISHYNQMEPFFMSIVSATDQWMYISSNGALTAGRKNPERALFPYYTVDKIHDYQDKTGSRTVLLVTKGNKTYLWEPFAGNYQYVYSIRRNIFKNQFGNKLIFQEINEDLSLTFQYGWVCGNRYGFIKQSRLFNDSSEHVSVNILDGLQNILPWGVDSALQAGFSNLIDAYKKAELVPETTLGLYRLSSIPVDTAEPSEALKVNTVWSAGLGEISILLSDQQVNRFRRGEQVNTERDIKACRGAYFVQSEITLPPGTTREWNMIAEVSQDSADVAGLIQSLKNGEDLVPLLHEDIEKSTSDLARIIAASDGLQRSADELSTSRHLSNVLYNVMRGGLFEHNYVVFKSDLLAFISKANTPLYEKASRLFASLEEHLSYHQIIEIVLAQDDPNLIRLCYEYLPISFSRRHGDPSRPWNRFSIETRNENGVKNFSYQGNWRDIFQNWEALGMSFPEYLEGMICKFVNASTPDGYNPYRITRDGIDWERPDPADPWANIGYWGDHQVIYLLKLLELSNQYHPGQLKFFLNKAIFSYAHVPYQIKTYPDLLSNPHQTIEFDYKLDEIISNRSSKIGSDGKLFHDKESEVIHVTLTEKLLVSILVRLSNFIPGAGIWMNTQRPEWNDANNALVGYGVSLVTTGYLRRYIRFCYDLFSSQNLDVVVLSAEVADLLEEIGWVLSEDKMSIKNSLTDSGRKKMMDGLGLAGSKHRQAIYSKGFSGSKKEVPLISVLDLLNVSLKHLDATLLENKRSDNLYHSYNLLSLENNKVRIGTLYEMLEGQVSVISSGLLSASHVVNVLSALRNSSMFREEQFSYILYPDRKLPLFTEKNTIPSNFIEGSELLRKLLEDGNSDIVKRDVSGNVHFNGNFRNAQVLKEALNDLPEKYAEYLENETGPILNIYEALFDHKSFTGRSGTFYGFEGLGSIYWHMVSKLLLAVGEAYYRAYYNRANRKILGYLADFYYEIRAGIGLNKDPEIYGAFPTDAYSHTPANKGAKQPGLTGQVKEDIIARWLELGVIINNGKLSFTPILLRKSEFLQTKKLFRYYDVSGAEKEIALEENRLAFTYCQVPVVYRISDQFRIILHQMNGKTIQLNGHSLNTDYSSSIFKRTGVIERIDVWLKPGL
jgi:hypothetical protein